MSTKTRERTKSSLSSLILKIRELKPKYKKEGLILLGLFGSYARGEEDPFSDIDIAYKIDHDKFYKDNAFKKLIRIEEIKKELESNLHKKVDIVSLNSNNQRLNESIKKEMVFI
jgi:predicted nucleotidyltransferase